MCIRDSGAGRHQRERPIMGVRVAHQLVEHRGDSVDLLVGVGEHGHANAHDWPFTLVSAGAERCSEPGREVFPAIESRSLDVYPGFPMALLPILEILRWCEESD